MLYYCPLESYKERYTFQLSAPKTGWLERNWLAAGIKYSRIQGHSRGIGPIKTGVVLDAYARAHNAFSQVETLLALAEGGELTSDDTIYFDDFWHPGIEALPYAFHLLGIKPKMYAFLWAQSVDEFDFTYKMGHWMRPFELGIAGILDGIFVASTMLKELLINRIVPSQLIHKVHVVGLPFDSEEVKSRFPVLPNHRDNKVVFSSRWDEEKDPNFFLQVALRVLNSLPPSTPYPVQFVICTGAEKLRSNNPNLLEMLKEVMIYKPEITLLEGLSKEQYYRELATAKVQFNCAKQDWVSYTLLEASTMGCWPIYPNFRSFPEALNNKGKFMYSPGNVGEAAQMIIDVLGFSDDFWSLEEIVHREWIHKRHDLTWRRMLYHMKLAELRREDLYPYDTQWYDK